MKSFKKSLAIFLAVMMVALSVPFTALAATALTKVVNQLDSDYYNVLLYDSTCDYIALEFQSIDKDGYLYVEPNTDIVITMTTVNGSTALDGDTAYLVTTPGWYYGSQSNKYQITTDTAPTLTDGTNSFTASGFVSGSTISSTSSSAIETVFTLEGGLDVGTYTFTCSYKFQMKARSVAGMGSYSSKYVTPSENGDEVACETFTIVVAEEDTTEYVNVTVTDSDYCDVSGLNFGVNEVAQGDVYSVTANAISDATFVGWQVNDRIVTTDTTFTDVASADITLTPVYSDEDTVEITFMDQFYNVVAVMTPDEIAESGLPTVPTYAGYTGEWELTADEAAALTVSTIVGVVYSATSTGYTVTTDAELTLPDGVENGSIPYDTSVTVAQDDATAWMINNTIVAYGSTYTFYVGADVEVVAVTDDVVATPAISIIDVAKISGSNGISFLATRDLADADEIATGFIYGKNLADDELVLTNVGNAGAADNAGTVKVAYATKGCVDQIALNYGISAAQGTASAVAFVTYSVDGVAVTTYSNVGTYTY